MGCANLAASVSHYLVDFCPVANAIRLQHFIRPVFSAERAVLFLENVAARKLAGRIRPAFCALQPGTEIRPGPTPRPLAARRQRGRSGGLLAIDPRPGTASPRLSDS